MKAPDHSKPRFQPALDVLEPRALLTSGTSNYYNQAAQHDYDVFVGALRRIELNSLATPAQYLALRDDSRALTAAVSSSSSHGNPTGVIAATLLIDRALLQGWLSDQGWSQVQARLTTDLAGFQVNATLIDKTAADMKAAAVAANVDPGTFQVLNADLASFQSGRSLASWHFHDPNVYYTQHLRGFFRGWAAQRLQDQAALTAEVNTVARQAGAQGSLIRRDANLLGQLGDPIPSTSYEPLTVEYVHMFSQGTPSAAASSAFRSVAISSLGATATAARTAAVDQLIADAPALFTATGGSAAIEALVHNVVAVVNDGQGSPLNPFKISILPGQ